MWLSLDTSLNYFVIALHNDNQPTIGICLPTSDERTRVAYTFLDGFFKENHIDLQSISKIAVGIGPGPYIAVRTGVSLANGLAAGLNVKILPVCSLLLMHPQPDHTPVLYRRPARTNEELWMALRNSAGLVQYLSPNDTWHEFDYTTAATNISVSQFIDEVATEHQAIQIKELNPESAVDNLILTTKLTANYVQLQPEVLPTYLRAAR